MKARAAAYVAQHAVMIPVDGVAQLMLPLDKLQGFLDLLLPSDVPPEYVQRLYAMQATAVQTIQSAFADHVAAAPDPDAKQEPERPA